MGILRTGFGIDLRQNHLILTLLKKSFGRIRVVDMALHTIPPEEQKEEREAQFISLINHFILKHGIKKNCVSMAIPREKSILRFISLPASTQENLRRVLEYETPKYTPFEKEEVYLDYHLLKKENGWLSLMVVYAKRSDIDAYLSLLKKVGIKPLSIQIPSVSAFNLFSHYRGANQTEISVLMEVSQPFIEINLVKGDEWRESLHLPLESEDAILHPVSLLGRSALDPSDLPKTTLFVYGVDADERLISHLKETDGLKGVSEPPIGPMKITGAVGPYFRIYPSLGVPLGEMVTPRIDLNLLPLELRKKRRKIAKPLFIALLAFLVILGLIQSANLYLNHRDELVTTTEEMKKRKPEVEAIERLQREREALQKEIIDLEKIRSDEVSKIEILKELTRLLPESVWVWNLKYNGKEIDITGYADSASDLISILDKSPLFEKVEFLSPVTRERFIRPEGPQEKERFRIKARLEARRPDS